ncbi:MAG: TIGR03936 family radical SAM-associated protein, partial [Candidatus Eisenbacteria bacterium]
EIVEAVDKITSNLCGITPIALSLPSTRPGTLPERLAKTMTEGKKPHLTLAPEAGTQRMRDVINKGVCEDELLESIAIAARQGYSGAKLYFMIGLPGERPEDIVGIAALGKKALAAGRAVTRNFTITISISPHVPKVQTPFQWETQDASLLIEEKVRILRREVKGSAIVLKWRDSETAFLEGVFSRGDRRLGAVILEAYRRGCRFDGWTEHLKYDTWMAVFADLGVDAARYLEARDPAVPQCWEHVASPVTRKFLLKEREKSQLAKVTVDCRLAFCHACGIDDCPDRQSPTGRRPGQDDLRAPLAVPAPLPLYGRKRKKTPLLASLALGTRFRLRYTKGADLRFISHLELMRAWERTLRRSGLPLALTQGFHPHLKMAFGPPLPVGYTSIAEYFDLEFAKPPAADLEDSLSELLPPGLSVTGWRPILYKAASLMATVDFATYRVRLTDSYLESGGVSPDALEDLLLEGISGLLGATALVVRRPVAEGVKEFDARPSLESLHPLPGARALDVGIRFLPRSQARPDELVKLALPQADARLLQVERTGLYRIAGEDRLTPFDLLTHAATSQEERRATG